MTTDNGFQPDRPPIFLSRNAEETGQPEIEKEWDVTTISSRILKASALAAVVTTIGAGALSVGNPVQLVASVSDWWNDKPAVQLEADASGSIIQTVADAQDAPATTDAPAREEVAAVAEPAAPNQAEAAPRPAEPVQMQAESAPRQPDVAQSQAETSPPVSAELFKQFQAWAAEEEARAGSAQARARVAQDAPQARPAKKQRRVHSVQNARAEVRPQRHRRAKGREEQDAQGQVPPPADPRATDPAAQNAQPPSFLQSIGIR